MNKYIILILLIIPHNAYADRIQGLNINIYIKISGLWSNSPNATPRSLESCKDCYMDEFGWGKSKYWPNSQTLIDPVKNNFQFSGLHLMPFKSFKQINPNLIDIELLFVDGNIQRYRIQIIKDDYISIVDNGSVTKYDRIDKYHTRLAGPDLKNGKYGFINGKSVRLRESFGINSKIIDLIHDGEKIFTIIKSDNTENINGDNFYWYKIISDSGYIGWVYGKYIKFLA